MRFLCDEMLAGLARWLRAAGYDALQALPGTPDRELVHRALKDGRTLLSRDRAILQIKGADGCVHLLANSHLDGWATELRDTLKVDWRHDPMSRCLLCNVQLQDASRTDIKAMPLDSQSLPGPFRVCPKCHRRYWPGSHVHRMMDRLNGFASGQSGTKGP